VRFNSVRQRITPHQGAFGASIFVEVGLCFRAGGQPFEGDDMMPAAGQRKLSHVIGADGSLLTLDDIPPITQKRSVVRQYEFFLFAEGQVTQKLEFECEDDAKAIDEAHPLAADHTVEIYCGYRLVGSLVAGKAQRGV